MSGGAQEIAKHVTKFPELQTHEPGRNSYFRRVFFGRLGVCNLSQCFSARWKVAQIEQRLWEICEYGFSSRCKFYAVDFPSGQHITQMESKLWGGCLEYASVCVDYAKAFQNTTAHRTQIEIRLWTNCKYSKTTRRTVESQSDVPDVPPRRPCYASCREVNKRRNCSNSSGVCPSHHRLPEEVTAI